MVDESSRLAFQLSMSRFLVNRYSSGTLLATAAVFRGRPRAVCTEGKIRPPGPAGAARNTEAPLAGLGTEIRL
jgi:hypothetical protein